MRSNCLKVDEFWCRSVLTIQLTTESKKIVSQNKNMKSNVKSNNRIWKKVEFLKHLKTLEINDLMKKTSFNFKSLDTNFKLIL